MSSSLRFLLPAMIVAIPVAVLSQSPPRLYPNVGTPLSVAEIQSFDRMIGPEGKELPPGHGTVKEGAEIFAKRCQVCHGKSGENGLMRSLGLHQPRDASQQSGIARPERRLRSGRVSVLLERHHQRRRRHGREDLAEGRDAEPEWLRPGSARVSPGKETQLVLSASGAGIGVISSAARAS